MNRLSTIDRLRETQRLSKSLSTFTTFNDYRLSGIFWENPENRWKKCQKWSKNVGKSVKYPKYGKNPGFSGACNRIAPGVGAARETGDTGCGRWMVHGYSERENGRCMALHGQKLNIMFSCGS